MEKKDGVNKCQYWVIEPLPCIYWNDTDKVCTYKFTVGTKNVDAQKAPYCNLLGTDVRCTAYVSPFPGSTKNRCVLPDPSRYVCNRITGNNWVTSSGTASSGTDSSYEILSWGFDSINGYNDGNCDSKGTDVTCSGYSPYHVGFGTLAPSDEDIYDTFKDGIYSITKEFKYRLPTNFVVCNIRSKISKCFWWKSGSTDFVVNSVTGMVELEGEWACTCTKDTSKYNDFVLSDGVWANSPPCNGCKPECPNYTGVCWQYCIDEKMESGDPILAEQIHELRYYHRENRWTVEAIADMFIDKGTIFAWSGIKDSGVCETGLDGAQVDVTCVPTGSSSLMGEINVTLGSNNSIEGYEISSIKTSMASFDTFCVDSEEVVLTEGTEVVGELPNYPTLINEVVLLPLSIIIKNNFEKNKFFEVKQLSDTSKIAIYGKCFYTDPVYAINISDKIISKYIPAQIFLYDSIYDIETALSTLQFDEFRYRFSAVLKSLGRFFPDKIISNTISEEEGVFLLNVPTLFGGDTWDGSNKNTILVFQNIGNYIVYDKTTFTKRVVGGILSQTEFSIRGDGLEVPLPSNYEADFNAVVNKNGTLVFKYVPFVSESISSNMLYMYNSSMYEGTDGTYIYGYVDYTMEAGSLLIDKENVVILGSNGYMIIDVVHPYLNNVLKPWEVEKIEIHFLDDEGNTSSTCEMEIVCHGASGTIGPQQLIIKPKNMGDYHSVCEASAIVVLQNITYTERRSFDEKPEETEFLIKYNKTPKIDILSKGDLVMDDNGFTIHNFQFTFTPTVVITNSKGIPFTSYKTKPIGDVKQVFCPSVEIMFSWGANAIVYDNDPWCRCCGPWKQINMYSVNGTDFSSVGATSGGPKCSDHPWTPSQSSGPIWYPFNSCESYATYDQINNHTNTSIDIMGVFQLKDSDDAWVHGQHDMRLLAGIKSMGREMYGCGIFGCTCGMQTGNTKRSSDPIFTGWGRVFGKVPDIEYEEWIEYGGVGPKFGNRHRQILRTYRTMDKVTCYDNKSRATSKLAPASMVFSKSDVTSIDATMWDYRCVLDGPELVNPLGLLTAVTFDSVGVNEEIDYYNRFRHDEVFRITTHSNLLYQRHTQGDSDQVPVYEFKMYIGGERSIQWAWQEPWKDIERGFSINYDISFLELVDNYINNDTSGNFKNCTSDGNCVLQSLDVTYPSYRFDYTYKEFRLIPDEGECVLNVVAPIKNEYTGEYQGFLSVQLNGGPIRGIGRTGEWLRKSDLSDAQDTEDPDSDFSKYNIELYEEAAIALVNYISIMQDYTINPKNVWATEVTLLDTGCNSKDMQTAEDDDRMVETYFRDANTGKLMTLKTHFQRGLAVQINSGRWPLKIIPINQLQCVEVFEEVICGTYTTQNMSWDFDNIKRTVGRVSITFKFGSEELQVEGGEDLSTQVKKTYKYYHQPKVSVYVEDMLLFETPAMVLYNGPDVVNCDIVTKTFEWDNAFDYIMDGKTSLTIKFGVTPTEKEISESEILTGIEGRYIQSVNSVHINNVRLHEDVLINATEDIRVWERKYYVSHGKHGDYPPQGTDGGVLSTEPEKVGVWQKDTVDGTIGLSSSNSNVKCMSKVRGRSVGKTYPYVTDLSGDRITMENEQKRLYDEAMSDAVADTTMVGVLPPGIQQLLDHTKVSFTGPYDLALHNSLLSPLADLDHGFPYAAEGHEFRPGPPEYSWCPNHECPLGSAFIYIYYNLDAELGEDIKTNFMIDENGNATWGGPSNQVRSSNDQFYYGQVPNMDLIESYVGLNMSYFPETYGRDTSSRVYANPTSKMSFSELKPYSETAFTVTVKYTETFYDDEGIGVSSPLSWW